MISSVQKSRWLQIRKRVAGVKTFQSFESDSLTWTIKFSFHEANDIFEIQFIFVNDVPFVIGLHAE